jgi:two-component system phosphate regulon response regulator OmpR
LAAESAHIAVVDDDPKIRTILRKCFEQEGYTVSEAATSAALHAILEARPVDLITLDLGLAQEDGLDIARQIRARLAIPIVMVTGKGDVVDRVVGLEIGADDYISKPFHLREVLARIRTVLRRSKPAAGAEPASSRAASGRQPEYRFEGWRLDPVKRELFAPSGTACNLTTAEFDLLVLLVKRSGQVLERDTIMTALKGQEWAANDRAIDTMVARLRKKVGGDSSSLSQTVRGIGYQFAAKVTQH